MNKYGIKIENKSIDFKEYSSRSEAYKDLNIHEMEGISKSDTKFGSIKFSSL